MTALVPICDLALSRTRSRFLDTPLRKLPTEQVSQVPVCPSRSWCLCWGRGTAPQLSCQLADRLGHGCLYRERPSESRNKQRGSQGVAYPASLPPKVAADDFRRGPTSIRHAPMSRTSGRIQQEVTGYACSLMCSHS
jgi:hypothetical protein